MCCRRNPPTRFDTSSDEDGDGGGMVIDLDDPVPTVKRVKRKQVDLAEAPILSMQATPSCSLDAKNLIRGKRNSHVHQN